MAQAPKNLKKPKATPLDRALNRIYRLYDTHIDLNLDRVHRLLYALGNPQDALPPVFHVAGTNGKGSTLAFLQAILESAGYSIHKHTSPHLVRFNERIILNGVQISDEALLPLIKEIERKNKKQPITFFEFCMAMFLDVFSKTPADAVLLETGLGGRLDASNVVKAPFATLITSIGLDHMRFLGDTVEKIALEKAGIMKPGTPCFIGKQRHDGLYDLFWQHAIAHDVTLYHHGKDWRTTRTKTGFDLHIDGKTLSLPCPNLYGDHQIDNAGLAIACLYYTGQFNMTDAHIRDGITHAHWPARMQHIDTGALAALAPRAQLWLDGSHNVDGATAIADVLKQWQSESADIHIIFGALETRDPFDLLSPLLPFITTLSTVSFDYPKARKAGDSADLLKTHDVIATPFDTIEEALTTLAPQTTDQSKILICGSLYLAGKILHANGK